MALRHRSLSHMQSLGDWPGEGENLKRLRALHRRRRLRARVGEEELVEPLPPRAAARREALPAVAREHPVRAVRAHLDGAQPRQQLLALDERAPALHQVVHDDHGGAQPRQQLLALDERAPALHQVVHDDHVPPRRLPLLELHHALVPVPHLGAHHLLHAAEEPVEPLPRPLVRVRDDDVLRVLALRQAVQQQRDAALEARQDVVAEVKPLLQRVDVEDDGAA
eukprot:CAMPEP_0197615168 /NCGR_PEP_ID=MMETSP1326-20131121/59895_1 /TAXON_ID=1155430 /ORGANISM="Genus nov. species nov., Strain RCC2288" /LENGTH=222 /DNA_ID=CAMNT_0043184049 /DNA_START=193 /DNA_END=859 /DNA_ORIENTATION=-